jgi:peptide/nickel transport system permease protein
VLRYTLVRLGQGLVVLLVVVTVVFLLSRLSGNTAEIMAPPDATPEQVKALEESLGLDRSLVVQYVDYLGDLVRGDLGQSFSYRAPVSSLIADALPNSIRLGLVSFVFAAGLGIAIGFRSGRNPGGWFDRIGKGVALLGQSVPSFWLGIVLVLIFAVNLKWVPAFGNNSWKSIILPAIALGGYALAAFTRLTRSAVIEVQRRDHTLFMRAKGVSPSRMRVHTLRNASLPIVTLAGIQLGQLFSGAVIIETLFAWPGVGQLAIQAINSRDYNVVQGVVLVNTMIFVGLLFLVDISYGLLDPRVRTQTRGATAS